MPLSKESADALRRCVRILARSYESPESRRIMARSVESYIQKGEWMPAFLLRDIPLLFYPDRPAQAEAMRQSIEKAVSGGWKLATSDQSSVLPADLATWLDCPPVPRDSPLRYWLPDWMLEAESAAQADAEGTAPYCGPTDDAEPLHERGKLFARVLHALEGNETTTSIWSTKAGPVAVETEYMGPDRWIKDVQELNCVRAWQCLALVLFAVRNTFDERIERRIVEDWGAELRRAVNDGQVIARDTETLLPLRQLPEGWEWMISMDEADQFVVRRGMRWTCSEQAAWLFEQCEGPVYRRAGELHFVSELQFLRRLKGQDDSEAKEPVSSNETALQSSNATAGSPSDPVSAALDTTTIARVFATIGYPQDSWPDILSGSKWPKAACVRPGRRGMNGAALWNPLELAKLLESRKKSIRPRLTALFRNDQTLAPWAEQWRDYLADLQWYEPPDRSA